MLSTRVRIYPACLACAFLFVSAVGAMAAHTNNILITGYWPPTNEMVRHFSTNPEQNLTGWEGQDWEGLGYDIHSYFPEFPLGVDVDPQGEGDFTVDYQDTSEDWWRITAEINPVAIITFSRGNDDNSWEVERLQRNWGPAWRNDYEAPFKPTPSPPDSSMPQNAARLSTLPMDDIVQSVNDGAVGVNAYIDQFGGGGQFLSEYIAYHGVWYQDLHSDPSDPFQSVAAGHIHVGGQVSIDQGRAATEISLRTLIGHVDMLLVPEPNIGVLLFFGALTLWRRRG